MPTREAFGFCDGSTLWINVNNVFHPLIKYGNTFEFIANLNSYKTKYKSTNIPIAGRFGLSTSLSLGLYAISLYTNSSDKYSRGQSVYQLNLDNGEFY